MLLLLTIITNPLYNQKSYDYDPKQNGVAWKVLALVSYVFVQKEGKPRNEATSRHVATKMVTAEGAKIRKCLTIEGHPSLAVVDMTSIAG
ncbi:hypothetical protein HZH68_016344 [Vespula germanica]|uniref:Uncharacterized protein n=1 Tax=Vespula germanica TaxID=30212 RepID=A0A834MR12_VESGE|nr:hypothetical protein HZH68_016344 [Vespula germanica]